MTYRIVKRSLLGKVLQLGMILILLIPSFVFSAGRNYSPRRRATSPSSRHSRSPSPTMSRSSTSSLSSLGHSRSPSPVSRTSSTSSIHLPSLPSSHSKGVTFDPGPPRTSDGSTPGLKEQLRAHGRTNLKRGMEGPYGTDSRGLAHPKELASPGGGAKAAVGRVMEDAHRAPSNGRSSGSLPPILKRTADAKSGKSTDGTLGGAANVSGSLPFVHPAPEGESLPEIAH